MCAIDSRFANTNTLIPWTTASFSNKGDNDATSANGRNIRGSGDGPSIIDTFCTAQLCAYPPVDKEWKTRRLLLIGFFLY